MNYNKAAQKQRFDRDCGVSLVHRHTDYYACYNYYGKHLVNMTLEQGEKHFPLAIVK